jgi:hypothetical protein
MSEAATETGTPAAGTETPAPGTEQPTGEQTPTGEQPGTEDTPDPRVTRANSEAARYRTERNALQQQVEQANAAQQTMLDNIAKALGLKAEDAGEDPVAQVGTLTTQVQTLTSEAAQLRAELLVHTIAGEHGANPVSLLDSRTFVNTLHGLDPAADDYRTKVADAIKAAVEQNATLKAGGQVQPTRGGAPEAGQGAGDEAGAVTVEQFKAMSYAERTALFHTNPALYRRLSAGG